MKISRTVSSLGYHVRRTACLTIGLLLSTLLSAEDIKAPSVSSANAAPEPTPERVGPLKLRDAGLDQILDLLERWTNKAVLRPQQLPANTVSLNLREEVSREEAIRALETLLNLNGVAITPLDEHFLKVTTLAAAKAEAPEIIKGSTLELAPSGHVASKLFRLRFLRIGEFMPQITGMLNAAIGSQPAVFEKANAALITDTISNLQKIEMLMVQLDRPEQASFQPKFYALKYAKASEVVTKLKTMLTGPVQTHFASGTSYNADDRTNQIVLFADAQQQDMIGELIAKLDVRSGQDTLNDVIYLKHAAAKDVASILSQLVAGQNNGKSGGGESVKANVAPQNPSSSLPQSLGLEIPTQFSALLTILPEERSNSIVVSGTADDIRLINSMVSKIDVLLAQVRIEVVIAEVTLSDSSTSGISELGLSIDGDKLTGVSASLPGMTVKDGVITRPDGKNTISGSWDLAAQITLASTPRKNNTHILSVPNIITTHNRAGKIFVGEQRPVISSYLNDTGSQATSSGSTGTGYRSTVNSKDIGIQLSVKPLIGTDGSVQLEITQEVNDILGDIVIDGNPQPRIGRRSTESFVSAKSGQIIVLGGLQRSSLSGSTSRFGPVPIIGDLLGARSKEKTRTDLVFFLRPTVLTNTSKDNELALQQLEKLPKPQREEAKQALSSTGR